MGLNSGGLVVAKIGDDLRMDYTAQAHTVGLAARMEQIAEMVYVSPRRNAAAPRPIRSRLGRTFRMVKIGRAHV